MGRGRPKKEKPPKVPRLPITCAYCEKEFIPKSILNTFCSRECFQDSLTQERETRNRARFYIFERDQFKCVYCGKSSIEHRALLLVDHIIPVSEGGDNSVYNVVTACFECNIHKANYILEESVYLRILERNKFWNNNLTPLRKAFIEKVMERIKRSSDMKYDEYENKRRENLHGGIYKRLKDNR